MRTTLEHCIEDTRPLCYGVVQPGAEDPLGVHLVRVQDIERGRLERSSMRTVSRKVDQEYRRSRVRSGDVLVSVVGTIGRTAIVPEGLEANIARAIARVTPGAKVLGRWIQIWLDTRSVQWWLLRSSREVARKTLNLGDLARLPIPVPSLSEQAEIVDRVDELFSLATSIEKSYEAVVTNVERLTPAILAAAFRGELVEQDPNEEPAEVMLQKLSRQRSEADLTKKSLAGRRSRAVRA